MRHPSKRARPAFSLVELLVAMALIVFIMSILSAAFAAASNSFRELKAVGDMAERLRGAFIILRTDLGAPHFDGNRKLGDSNFWRYGPGPDDIGPPREGYFRIYQDVPAGPFPGPVPPLPNQRFDGLPLVQISEYSTVRSALQFTVRLPGKGPGEMFATHLSNPASQLLVGPNFGGDGAREQRFQDGVNPIFRSQWAEVAWWLTPAVDQLGVNQEVTRVDGPQGNVIQQPLYVLRRRQHLLFSSTGPRTQGPVELPITDVQDQNGVISEISTRPGAAAGTVRVNKPADLTAPALRWNMQRPTQPAAQNDFGWAGWPTAFGQAFPVFPPAPAPGLLPAPPPNIYPAELPAGNPPGRVEDVVLNNVLSMDVRVLLHGASDFVDLYDASIQPYGVRLANNALAPRNPAFPFHQNNNTASPRVFDTWSRFTTDNYDYESNWRDAGNTASIPLFQRFDSLPGSSAGLIRIRAVMITIRIWDQKSLKTRQATIVQDL